MKKFKIPQIPQTTSKSIRFPNDVIDDCLLYTSDAADE